MSHGSARTKKQYTTPLSIGRTASVLMKANYFQAPMRATDQRYKAPMSLYHLDTAQDPGAVTTLREVQCKYRRTE